LKTNPSELDLRGGTLEFWRGTRGDAFVCSIEHTLSEIDSSARFTRPYFSQLRFEVRREHAEACIDAIDVAKRTRQLDVTAYLSDARAGCAAEVEQGCDRAGIAHIANEATTRHCGARFEIEAWVFRKENARTGATRRDLLRL
jgi:hypothetical protein